MVEYLEPVAMKFIIVTAALAAAVAIADVVLLVRRKGTARLEGLLPAVDSILVIAGFMAFTGTGIVLIQSAERIAYTNIDWLSTGAPPFSQDASKLILDMMLGAFATAIIAWFLFFVFFEVWLLLRFLIGKYTKKLPAFS